MKFRNNYILMMCIFIGSWLNLFCQPKPVHTFTQSDSAFILDGKPFLMISGEMHCARIPPEYWRDRLQKAKAMGLNTIGTYVFWNAHEPTPGVFDFSGGNDIAGFVRMAQEAGLWVVMRPSPYVCAEWEFGGYPWWLLKDSTITVRSKDPRFLKSYRKYLEALAKELAPLQITHGGNILMMQLENEYGSYSNDVEYLDINRRIFRDVGFDVDLFTCDAVKFFNNGTLPGYLPAVNGSSNPAEVKALVNKLHKGKGPYYVAEWYPGWYDDWGKKHQTRDMHLFAANLEKLLTAGISVNMYMFHGGTTRGFMNGANMNAKKSYSPQVSSYDYDAPLDEAGNPTEKFRLFRTVIEKVIAPGTKLPPIPAIRKAIELPEINLSESAAIFDNLHNGIKAKAPLSFENLGQAYGFILYRIVIDEAGRAILKINEARDFATVCVDGVFIGSLDRRLKQDSLEIIYNKGSILDILVENNGRINFGPYLNNNRHGLLVSPTLNNKPLSGWEMYKFPFADTSNITFLKSEIQKRQPALYKGVFDLRETGDTYLDMRQFGKGFVFLNGINLGKYWGIGPQQTIYVPEAWLKKTGNEVIVFDALKSGHRILTSLDHAILNDLLELKDLK